MPASVLLTSATYIFDIQVESLGTEASDTLHIYEYGTSQKDFNCTWLSGGRKDYNDWLHTFQGLPPRQPHRLCLIILPN